MANSHNHHLRALVPGCVFDEASVGELEAVFHPETGVLNVLTPGVDHQGIQVCACPVYENAGELPAWAQQVLADAERKMSRKEVLQHLIQSTHSAIEEAQASGLEQAAFDEPGEPGESAEAGELSEPEPLADGSDASGQADNAPVRFCLLREGNALRALCDLGELEVERYDLVRNVFSRNTGILETDVMASKRAVILGCGSVGSLVAVELARAGVGHFLLVDMDVMEYHNICRHCCGIADVGRRKPDAVGDLVRNINPTAVVETCYTEVQQASRELLETWCIPGETVVIGCADNRGVDIYANEFAADFGVPFLSIGFWERAFAGELFYWIPGQNHVCYRCALGGGEGLSQRVEANHHIYTSQTDLAAVNFEPGIAVDIDFVTIVGVKLALDLFNRGDSRFTPRLLPHLVQYTLVCNTNNPAIGGVMAEIFSYPLQVTTSLQVIPGQNCAVCATR